MKKVLIGAGIGCGALVVIAIVGVMVAGMWAKGKVENLADRADVMDKQEQRVAEMNKKYSFTPPAKGLPVELTDSRIQDYLAIRASLTPVFKDYETKAHAKGFDKHDKDPSITDAMEAGGMIMDLLRDVRVKWLTELDQKRMSPAEFHAITAAIYTSGLGAAMDGMADQQRAALEQMKQSVEQQMNNPNVPQEQKDEMKESLAELNKQLAALPPRGAAPSEATKLHVANAKLVEKYKKQIEDDANMGLDMLLPGYVDDNGGLGAAMENIDLGMPGADTDDTDSDEGAEAE